MYRVYVNDIYDYICLCVCDFFFFFSKSSFGLGWLRLATLKLRLIFEKNEANLEVGSVCSIYSVSANFAQSTSQRWISTCQRRYIFTWNGEIRCQWAYAISENVELGWCQTWKSIWEYMEIHIPNTVSLNLHTIKGC